MHQIYATRKAFWIRGIFLVHNSAPSRHLLQVEMLSAPYERGIDGCAGHDAPVCGRKWLAALVEMAPGGDRFQAQLAALIGLPLPDITMDQFMDIEDGWSMREDRV
jgi:hypothetical protein